MKGHAQWQRNQKLTTKHRQQLPILRDAKIKRNDRICQFRIQEHQPAVNLVKTDILGNANRGGLGSTGRG